MPICFSFLYAKSGLKKRFAELIFMHGHRKDLQIYKRHFEIKREVRNFLDFANN